MVRKVSSLDQWWEGSLLYKLLAGSFFFRWLVGVHEYDIDYVMTSQTAVYINKLIAPLLKWLYHSGNRLKGWMEGSLFFRTWLSWLGAAVILLAVVVLRITLSWEMALALVLIGLGLVLTKSTSALANGTYLGRLTGWWLND